MSITDDIVEMGARDLEQAVAVEHKRLAAARAEGRREGYAQAREQAAAILEQGAEGSYRPRGLDAEAEVLEVAADAIRAMQDEEGT